MATLFWTRVLGVGLGLGWGWALPAHADKIQTFIYDYSDDRLKCPVTLQVEERSSETIVTYLNEAGDREVTRLADPQHPLDAEYYDPQGKLTGKVTYDAGRKKVILQGVVQAQYPLTGIMLENNGSNFYVFSHWYPPAGQSIRFKFVQGNFSRLQDPFQRFLLTQMVGPVPMALKHVGQENVAALGQTLTAEKYELAVGDSGLAAFWPHKYYFWYDSQRRWPLRHQGMTNQNQPNGYVLAEVKERILPAPELPSL